MRRGIQLVLILIACFSFVSAQQKDSSNFYIRLKKIAYKKRVTRMAFDAIFVNPDPVPAPEIPPKKVKTSQTQKTINPYIKHKGKIIRKIDIRVLDPFGRTIYDTVERTLNVFHKVGNNLHVRTRQWVIHNRLMFDQYDTLNPLEISESERLIRQLVYVNDAKIEVVKTKSKDSVDVRIVVQDKWPINVPFRLKSATSASARIKNNNLFGVGQQFEQYMSYSHPDRYRFRGYYQIANIDETFISSRLNYTTGYDGSSVCLGFDRPFYSPLAKWAGGLSGYKAWNHFEYTNASGELEKTPIGNTGFDVWGAKSTKLRRDGSFFNQSTNIVTGLRYFQHTFQQRPDMLDGHPGYKNFRGVVGNAGLAIQQYYKEKYIYRFGANEDVPEGLIAQLIYGGVKQEGTRIRYYTGVEVARARHLAFGYVSASFQYGVYFNTGVENDVTTRINLYYFSNLLKAGRWNFRQFVNYDYVNGQNKRNGERITFARNDLYGFDPGGLNGTTRMVMNYEAVGYAPYSLIGFKFAPVFMMGFGTIGDGNRGLFKSPVYQAYALGLMIRNEHLITNTFQISVGFYPFLPDGRSNVLLYSPVTSFTLRVRAFALSRPVFIGF